MRALRPSIPALVLTALVVLGGACAAQAPPSRNSRAGCFSFEDCPPFGTEGGWGGGPIATLSRDTTRAHGGRASGLITRNADSEGEFSSITETLPVDFEGKALELRGWLRLENVQGFAGLWQRQDGRGGSVQFDNMMNRNLSGTIDWTEYRVALPLDPEARSLSFGALLAGTGRVWVDDLELLVDGRPFHTAPARVLEQTAVDTDHEFDAGSGLAPGSLSAVQVDNLVTLGKVWGFVKYHHPKVTSAQLHWDYELFRVLPAVLAANDRAAGNKAIDAWLDARVGDPPPCNPCAKVPDDPHLQPRLDWIRDRARLGDRLAARLVTIHERRDADGKQFYVSRRKVGAGNAEFADESMYPGAKAADAGMQLLGVYRFWNIIEYWFPYRDVIGEDWDHVLAEFVPRAFAAKTTDETTLVLMELVARVHDGHANLWSGIALRPPVGDCIVPVSLRPVEGQFVVDDERDSAATTAGTSVDFAPGDAIVALDGVPVADLVAKWRKYYGASNDAGAMRDIARALTQGACGSVRVTRDRGGVKQDITVQRIPTKDRPRRYTHDRPGDTFRRVSDDIAYLKLSTVATKDAQQYVRGAEGAKLLVIDVRNYPKEFMVFALGQLLVAEKTQFVEFTAGDLTNPGAFSFAPKITLEPRSPRFGGRVALLVDESTQSQAEYTTMAFRSAPGAVVVGSTTAGADGNASNVPLPGGRRAMITGLGVFTPDRKPTQRVGILPDVEVRPTRRGLAEGRDEVLEAAVQHVLGRPLTDTERAALGLEVREPVGGRAPAP